MTNFETSPDTQDNMNIPAVNHPSRIVGRERWWLFLLVSLAAFAPLILSSTQFLLHWQDRAQIETGSRFLWGLMQECAALLVLYFALWRTGRTYRTIGFSPSIRKIGIAAVLAFVAITVSGVAYIAIQFAYVWWTGAREVAPPFRKLFTSANPIVFTLYVLLAPFFEEMLVRAYLMTEVAALTGSMTVATIASVLVQTSYHLYQGWVSAGALFFLFLVFSLYYARTRDAFAVFVAHLLIDCVGLWGILSSRA